MTIASNFPAIKPSLLLDFANTEQLDPRITFTRTTTATYYDDKGILKTAAAGVARFDHNPTTGESLGLLVEEQRTNLLLRSDDFANAYWTKTRSSITSNTIVAPDGTLIGDKLVEDTTASNSHFIISTTVSATNGTTVTASCYVKAGERTFCRLRIGDSGFVADAIFNLSTGAIASGTYVSASIISVGNGWYRATVTGAVAAGNIASLGVYLRTDASTESYTGDGYSGIYIWGAQLEQGAFSTSYIATTSATVTRNADAASMTGTNFSSWFRADEGTLYAESSTPQPSSTFMGIVNLGKQGTTTVSFQLGRNGTNSRGFGDGVSIDQGSNTYPVNTFVKQAEAGAVNNFALSTNGSNVATDTSTNPMPSDMNYLRIRDAESGNAQFSGYLKKLAFYPARLTNAQLQALTS
jgi:hypothetical protein